VPGNPGSRGFAFSISARTDSQQEANMKTADTYTDLDGNDLSLARLDRAERRLVERLRRRAESDQFWIDFRDYGHKAIARFYAARGYTAKKAERTAAFNIFVDLSVRVAMARGYVRERKGKGSVGRRRWQRPRVPAGEMLYELHHVGGPADRTIDFALRPYFWMKHADKAVYRAKMRGRGPVTEPVHGRMKAITLYFAGYWPAVPEPAH
jgi:hypothetical protein